MSRVPRQGRTTLTTASGSEFAVKGELPMAPETREALTEVAEAMERSIAKGYAFDLNEVKLKALASAPDRLDWRYVLDECGDWAAYFHPDWEADATRIVLAEEPPSPNERACIELLDYAVPRLPLMLHRLSLFRAALRRLLDDCQAAGVEPISAAAARRLLAPEGGPDAT